MRVLARVAVGVTCGWRGGRVGGGGVGGRRVRGFGWGAAAVGSSVFPWWVGDLEVAF